jgi:thiamine kinase-like enzyme
LPFLETKIRALRARAIDWSDYVLIASAILRELLGYKVHEELSAIQIVFLHNQSDAAITKILELCHTYSKINPSLFNFLISRADMLNNSPMLLESRRYFETQYSQLLWSSMGSNEFKSIQKIADLMHEENSKIVEKIQVNSLEGAARTLCIMREYSEFTPASDQVAVLISEFSSLYTRKDRGKKITDTRLSTNMGIMRSMSPCPLDQRGSVTTNRHPDIFTIDSDIEQGFSSSRPDIPYVNSVSGTVFAFLSVLKALLHKHQNESQTQLQSDVNHLLKAFITYSCFNGYHSLAEMIEVIKEPEINKLLLEYGLHFNLNFSQAVLQQSFNLAIEYAIQTNLHNEVMHEIRQLLLPSKLRSHTPLTDRKHNIESDSVTTEKLSKHIFSFALADLASIATASRVNKSWNRFINKEFPINLAHRLFPALPIKMAKRIHGGWTNMTMLLETSETALVGRSPGKNSNDFIDRTSESGNIKIAYQLGLAPQIVLDKQDGVLLTQYLDNPKAMTPTLLKNTRHLHMSLRILKLLHESKHNLVNDIDVFARNDRMFETLALHQVILPQAFQEIKNELNKVREIINKLNIQKVPCHNDACPGNFIESNGCMKLIDWEYSGNNDPLWDLVALSNEGEFSEEQNKTMFRIYFDAELTEEIMHRFVLYKPVYVCWAYVWAKVQLANQNLAYGAKVLHEIARQRFDELRTILKSNEYQDALISLNTNFNLIK